MSGKKITIDNIFSKEYIKDIKIKKNLHLFSPELSQKFQIKKIFLDCLSLKDDKNPTKSNKNSNIQKTTPKIKSFSLYKQSIQNNKKNTFSKIGNNSN